MLTVTTFSQHHGLRLLGGNQQCDAAFDETDDGTERRKMCRQPLSVRSCSALSASLRSDAVRLDLSRVGHVTETTQRPEKVIIEAMRSRRLRTYIGGNKLAYTNDIPPSATYAFN
jgi:hypothetical protein